MFRFVFVGFSPTDSYIFKSRFKTDCQRNIIKMKKAILNWSGGKDCTLSLRSFILDNPDWQVSLLTTFYENTGRVSMHGIRRELIENQASQLGLNLEKVYLPNMPDNATYEKTMTLKFRNLKKEGISISIFGDIFLEDLRKYREKQLANTGIEAEFPLWKRDTVEIAREFIASGFRAVIISANEKYFNPQILGAEYNEEFLSALPREVDPCGENGEFHTFVYDGPGFKNAVKFSKGTVVSKYYASPDGGEGSIRFSFLDLIPV